MTKALHFLLRPHEIFMRPGKPAVTLSADKQALSIQELRAELQERVELKVGSFEAKELLDWFGAKIDVLYCNQAIADAQKILAQRLELIEGAGKVSETT